MNSKIDLKKVEEIIVKNYKDKTFSINKLNQILNISDSYLRDIFYTNYGISPQLYIEKIRLEHVLRIYSPNLTLYEMSGMAGFKNERAFRYAFKKHFKINPSILAEKNDQKKSNVKLFLQDLIHKLWTKNIITGDN